MIEILKTKNYQYLHYYPPIEQIKNPFFRFTGSNTIDNADIKFSTHIPLRKRITKVPSLSDISPGKKSSNKLMQVMANYLKTKVGKTEQQELDQVQ